MNSAPTERRSHPLLRLIGVGAFGLVVYAGLLGVGLVWMRYQATVGATAAGQLERRVTELKRRESELEGRLAAATQPARLNFLNGTATGRARLAPPTEARIVRVSAQPEELLAARRHRDLFRPDPAAAGPVLAQAGIRPARPTP